MKENTGATPQLNMVPQPPPGVPQPVTSTPLRRGGQTGNQNARVHGFYSKKAPFYRQDIIDEASELEGIDAEIGFLRSCLQYVSELDPPNPKLAADIVRTLSLAMVRRKYSGHTVLIEKARRIVGDDHPDTGTDARAVEVAPAVEK